MNARGKGYGSFGFGMILLADVKHIAVFNMRAHQSMGADHIRAGGIDNAQSFGACFLTHFVRNAVCREDDNALINLIKQLLTCFLRVFDKPDAEPFTFAHNELIVHDHAEHGDFSARVFLCGFLRGFDCADNTGAIAMRHNIDNFHN